MIENEDNVHDYGRPYFPERNYLANGYVPIGEPKEHFCKQCVKYYARLNIKNISKEPFMPQCHGDIVDHNKIEQGNMTDEEYGLYNVYADPVAFAKAELNWVPRWYQKEMLRCTSYKKVARAGRRSGKTEVMAVKILYLMYTNVDFQILVVCPYQSQVDRVFEIVRTLIAGSYSYKESVTKDNSSPPQLIKLENGSQVKGFSSGAKSGGKSTQIRGQDAHAIFLDEMDYLGDDDLEAILAILASHPDCQLWASSTPTGNRGYFFHWIIDKNNRFKEFHYLSSESPSWTPETEEFLKEQYPDAVYAREFLAEFGEESYGIYKNVDINKALRDYTYEKCQYNGGSRYILGVDWNQNAGTHMVVVECFKTGDGTNDLVYLVVDKLIIARQEFTQIKSVEEIVRLTHKWSVDYIYVDAGYGATQVEMLRKFGKDNPKTKIAQKVKPVEMGGNLLIRDPFTNEKVKKPAKAFIVGQSAKQLEAGLCVFPRSEDTNAVVSEEDGDGGEQVGLVQQMRMYRVEKIAKSGSPTYTQGYDHTLTAWQLAIAGFVLEYSDIRKMMSSFVIATSGRFGEKQDKDGAAKKTDDLKKKLMPAPRALSIDSGSYGQGTLGALKRDKFVKQFEHKQRQDRGKMPPFKPGKRSSF
jgi:hypothetical protein